ncbi:very short patch repair endonuclease [Brevundimonas sp. 3P9-tot-E]|uniref:very short patch repair endonuclease n=1 Tax=Brevundimonas TaxID=41275 RepID=UPI000F776BE4|nr:MULTISPECIES: very short patch repair endonuclease [Brevundimonas]MDA0744543.1 very short patch repair endonuclease [Pseudomonadota bacterium]MBK1969956.1 DNA mismatch endonuclease Vsr [Brevundimonas diminuta]MBK1976510.1 DNA mismatch endonuclease Vsr [Brevundimonas diminuta]MDM8353191.1 very short patch repair endonuclease [Brevundimonas diminuta]RSB43463.1 DNA mismatch endonuclease Vsr [Brevundimonas sp. 357]
MAGDVFTPEKRSAVMRRVKDRDTSPEIKVRRVLRSAGIGYRLGGCGLPGRPDVVMKGRRIALFVHGCFWHDHDCPRGARKPKGNAAYWAAKIERNHARDIRVAEELTAAGWRVLTLWECELKTPDWAERLAAAILRSSGD